MRTSRFFEMIYLLMERGSMTAQELSERFEVSVRTIYRDIDVLSGAGIPVCTSRGRGGGIRLMPGFVLEKSMLSRREQDEILSALQSVRAAGGEDSGVLSRLSGLFRREASDWIQVDFTSWGGGDSEREKFQLLKTGILERRLLTFTYYNANGVKSSRIVEPLKLRFQNISWYLEGFCRTRKDYRLFKLTRMERLCLTEEYFLPREEMKENTSGSYGINIHLELKFSQSAAFRVYDEFAPGEIRKGQDGSLLISADYPDSGWIVGYLLSYGQNVEVISPANIREKIREEAKKIYCKYDV